MLPDTTERRCDKRNNAYYELTAGHISFPDYISLVDKHWDDKRLLKSVRKKGGLDVL